MAYESIIQKLTLEQKCMLLSGKNVFETYEIKKAGIPSIWLSDGPHGLRKQAGPADHLGLNPSEPATCFPTAATAACSWNTELGEEIGEALGQEAAASDVHVVLGPGLNMKRNPLCGRNFEYFSEDPYLAGKMAAAYIRGIQKNGTAACPKHFAVNNQETRRMASDSVLDERTLREIYLTGFEIAVKEGKPKCIMSSYNLINGTYANENKHLLGDILRKDWGFDGAVVTDWGGSNDHAAGVAAGSTLEMPAPGLDSVRELICAVENKKVSEADIDARLEELLTLVFETDGAVKAAKKQADFERHHALARKAAAQSITLLKNDGNLLPVRHGRRVGIIGDFAKHPRYQGAGSSVVNAVHVENLLDALKDSGIELAGYAQGFDRHGKEDELLMREAIQLAKHSEMLIVCMGLDEIQESEGLDRRHMRLNKNQLQLLRMLRKVNDQIAVVLFSGSAVETSWQKYCQALLYAGLGGEAGAAAVADALTGKINPCGKLAESWPKRYTDVPSAKHFAGKDKTTEYREGIYIGYRYFQKAGVPAAFPFGFGMSYTAFAYSQLRADTKQAVFTVKNTGAYDGAEIVQLYVSMPGKEVFSPVRELKGFARVELKAGESKEVTIPLDDKAFRYWNVRTNRWETEGGAYVIGIGASSEDIRLSAQVEVSGTGAPTPYEGRPVESYARGDVLNVSDEAFEALLGRKIPEKRSTINRNMTFGELNHSKSPLLWIVWIILTLLLRRSMKRGKPDLNILFVYNMPLRALAKMTSGMVSMGMVDGIVMEAKGQWGKGIVKVIREYLKNRKLNQRMAQHLKIK